MEPIDKVWVVIPAYNEEKHIGEVIEDTKNYVKNIAVVDDGSTDKTASIAKKHKVIVLQHLVNLGKGAALKTGCIYALKRRAKIIIAMDADGQHEAKDIPKFLQQLKEADVVLGYRTLGREMPLVLRFGNWFINTITKFLYRIKVKDTQCGYRAFKREAWKKLQWTYADYSMESEMIANIGKHKLKYKELPIATKYPDRYKGTTVIDGMKIVSNMLWWKLSR